MTEAVERTKAAIARGDLAAAYDITIGAIEDGDASLAIRHQQVLAIARMGDVERAMMIFQKHGLDRSDDPHHRAMGARLLKDQALLIEAGPARGAALGRAFAAYRDIYANDLAPYPGINAASLALLNDQSDEAHMLAQAILDHAEIAVPADYYAGATRAEALLILGRADDAAAALRHALTLPHGDYGARSSTYRQLSLIARHLGMDAGATDRLFANARPPAVAHYCGHMFTADDALEVAIVQQITASLDAHNVGFAYGSLAAGGDILVAEAVLARGAELHITFPFAMEDFVEQSVLQAGEAWLPRFERCLAAATSHSFASEMHFVDDPRLFGYAGLVAMGRAKLRADHLGSAAIQIAVSDGRIGPADAGTGADISTWQSCGGQTDIIVPGPINRDLPRPPGHAKSAQERQLAAILFTDFPGFSKLSEADLPAFWDGVMQIVADVLKEHEDDVLCRNSWGDALYAVMSSAVAGAEVALKLQKRLRSFDYSSLGLAQGEGMRIGVHYGPVYLAWDHVTARNTYYGTEVSRAARIEPVTPPGAVFTTEPFAAILALEAPEPFDSRYVGKIELAKGYGTYPMYRLTQAGAA